MWRWRRPTHGGALLRGNFSHLTPFSPYVAPHSPHILEFNSIFLVRRDGSSERRHRAGNMRVSGVLFFCFFCNSLDPFLPYVRAHSCHISPFNSLFEFFLFFSHSTHFSHMSEPILPISHLLILRRSAPMARTSSTLAITSSRT